MTKLRDLAPLPFAVGETGPEAFVPSGLASRPYVIGTMYASGAKLFLAIEADRSLRKLFSDFQHVVSWPNDGEEEA